MLPGHVVRIDSHLVQSINSVLLYMLLIPVRPVLVMTSLILHPLPQRLDISGGILCERHQHVVVFRLVLEKLSIHPVPLAIAL